LAHSAGQIRYTGCGRYLWQIVANKQKFPYLVGSKWTAQQKMWGWRHFQVVNRKNDGRWVFAEMVASCDPEVRFWVNVRSLKDRSQWQPGWQSLQELATNEDDSLIVIE
jgi:tryptophan-rich hypothetical protein